MLSVAIIGTGYVGLVTGACLAELGHDVICVDNDENRIDSLRRGRIPFYEPGLDTLVAKNVKLRRLGFTADVRNAVQPRTLIIFIAVGTPTNESDGSADLSFVKQAVAEAARARAAVPALLRQATIFAMKSTVTVGTCRGLIPIIMNDLPVGEFAIASNPEFLREGSAIRDFMEPDRIVVSSPSDQALQLMEALYAPLIRRGHRMLTTGSMETAELMKYACNAFLATKIAFINELSRTCEIAGADVRELAHGMGLDHRIGPHCLNAGPGFGGSCFPKDLRALVALGSALGTPLQIANAVYRGNEQHKRLMADKIRTALGRRTRGKRVAFLGLSFKAGTDDMREAASLIIIPSLLRLGIEARAYDPIAERHARRLLPQVHLAASVEEAVRGADAVVILTEWEGFQTFQWNKLAPLMRRPLLVDLRNICDPLEASRQGMELVPLGYKPRPMVLAAAAE